MYTYAVAVVDDAEVVRLLLLRRMQALGLKAVACANGRELLDRIERGELFRLIMMDRSMPVCNGEEATAAIRRMGILSSVTAIVGLTGETNPACLMDFQQSGCDAVFMKPLLPTDFTSVVRRYLSPFLASVSPGGAPASAEDREVAERVKALDGSVPAPAQCNVSEAETPGLLVAIAATITTLDQFKRHAATESVRIMAPFFEAMQFNFEQGSVEEADAGERSGGAVSAAAASGAQRDSSAGWGAEVVVLGGAAMEPVLWHDDRRLSGFGDSDSNGMMGEESESEGDPDLTAFLGDFIEHMDEGADVTSRQAQVAHLGAVDGALWHLTQHGDMDAGGGGASPAALYPEEFLHIARELKKALAASAPLKVCRILFTANMLCESC